LLAIPACNSGGNPANEWTSLTCTDSENRNFIDPRAQRASALLRAALEKDNGTGVSAAVMIDGNLVWSESIGMADISKEAELSTKAKMRLGSISKPITAALAIKLADINLLDLDAPIQKYVPEFPLKSGEITIRNLLAHTSGIRQYNFSSFSESNSRVQYDNASQSLHLFSDDPLLFEPGDEFYYSSFGYNLIGAAIENVTGVSFGEVLEEYLVEPMNLKGTTIDDPTQFIECRSNSYTIAFGRLPMTTIWRNHSDAFPSAGLLSTAEDLAEFTNQVFSSDFVTPSSQTLFSTEAKLNNNEKIDRSFAWELGKNENGEIEWYGHGGTTNGAYASIRYYPQTQVIVTGIANYNYWLTGKRPEFFNAVRQQIPELFNN
jgi:CubicO group peptidase (beta-lactamase class C family)